MKYSAKSGFTLIELSIVLVIIGLIVGGIVAGRELIRQSQLASIITDENTYVAAARMFQQKYNALPGDMPNATSYWGTDPGGCPDNGPWNNTPKTTTCNGNGNGFIQNDGTGETVPNEYENFLAWQHLSDAGMIKGQFTGNPGAVADLDNEPGFNVPATKLSGGGFEWTVMNANSKYPPSATWLNPKLNTQYLLLGNNCWLRQYCNHDLTGFLLSGTDALAIDTKIDDGNPGTGMVLGAVSYDAVTNSSCAGSGTYNTLVTLPLCTLLFQVNW